MKKDHIDTLIERYPQLDGIRDNISLACDAVVNMAKNGGKLLLLGNGGSCADCSHISGELLKGFLLKRPVPEGELDGLDPELRGRLQQGVRAIPLPELTSLLSAFANDVDADTAYAQLVYALGGKYDVLLGISTSGNAENIVRAFEVAGSMGLTRIALTGTGGGRLGALAEITVNVPERETFKVQELHLPVYHAICAQVEQELFEKEN